MSNNFFALEVYCDKNTEIVVSDSGGYFVCLNNGVIREHLKEGVYFIEISSNKKNRKKIYLNRDIVLTEIDF